MTDPGSVSCWIEELKAGNTEAAQNLWQRYYGRLINLARKKLGEMPRRVVDEQDVIQEVFNSFCLRARDGLFPKLTDRDQLWGLLVVITARKAANERKHQRRAKRGGGEVRGDSVFGKDNQLTPGFANLVGREHTPEFSAKVAEELQELIAMLDSDTHRDIAIWKLEGWTNKEIAAKLECSLSAVERKLRMIRSRLTDRDKESQDESLIVTDG